MINIGSGQSQVAVPGTSVYSATKGAVDAIMRFLFTIDTQLWTDVLSP